MGNGHYIVRRFISEKLGRFISEKLVTAKTCHVVKELTQTCMGYTCQPACIVACASSFPGPVFFATAAVVPACVCVRLVGSWCVLWLVACMDAWLDGWLACGVPNVLWCRWFN